MNYKLKIKKVVGSIQGLGPFCVVSACSSRVCEGSLWLLHLPVLYWGHVQDVSLHHHMTTGGRES